MLKTAKKLISMREEIINAFKKGIFPYIDGVHVEKGTDEEKDEKSTSENEEIEKKDMPELEK